LFFFEALDLLVLDTALVRATIFDGAIVASIESSD